MDKNFAAYFFGPPCSTCKLVNNGESVSCKPSWSDHNYIRSYAALFELHWTRSYL